MHAVAIEERHGFVWAQLEGPLDVKSFLGPELDEDFAEFELDRHHVLTSGVHVRRANWKLVVDAFCEAYHVPVLHAQTLARFFIEPQVVHDCAPHIRQFGGRRSLLEARDQPSWELREHATILYNVFPNTALIFHPLWIGALTILPEAVDRVRVIHRCLVSEGYDREKVEKSFTHIDRLVVHGEDLAMVESIQSTLHAGSREMILGGCEEGVRLFHAARDAALRGS